CHFFFQAEDGIRDRNVTGVQTCALPISLLFKPLLLFTTSVTISSTCCWKSISIVNTRLFPLLPAYTSSCVKISPELSVSVRALRSEERRVGKECWSW